MNEELENKIKAFESSIEPVRKIEGQEGFCSGIGKRIAACVRKGNYQEAGFNIECFNIGFTVRSRLLLGINNTDTHEFRDALNNYVKTLTQLMEILPNDEVTKGRRQFYAD